MWSVSSNKRSSDVENKVSQGTAKCDVVGNELIALQQQVVRLNENILSLKDIIQVRDAQLESAHQEKDRLLAELKKQQRYNRNLRQQLEDERLFYQRGKDRFAEEIQRYRIRYTSKTSRFQQRKELEQTQDALEAENKQLRKDLADKSKITYNLCIKFLRMKHAKDTLRYKLDQLLREHLLVMAEMMEKLDEARQELNLIVSEKFQEPLPLDKAKFLQVVQRNNRLMYENATLKVKVHQLIQNIEKLKNHAQKPKKININAKIIEKLSMQGNTRSTLDKTEKIALLRKFSQSVEYPVDTEIVSRVPSRNVNDYTLDDTRDVENYEKVYRSRTRLERTGNRGSIPSTEQIARETDNMSDRTSECLLIHRKCDATVG